MTTISGYIYDAQGNALTKGVLTLALQQDIISTSGTKVAPFVVSADLSTASPLGYVSVSVYPTVGATPSGLTYLVEFDPDPTDTTKPKRSKDGYWSNYWSVPNVGSVGIGSFSTALRGLPVTDAVNRLSATPSPTAGGSLGYFIVEINGVLVKLQGWAL